MTDFSGMVTQDDSGGVRKTHPAHLSWILVEEKPCFNRIKDSIRKVQKSGLKTSVGGPKGFAKLARNTETNTTDHNLQRWKYKMERKRRLPLLSYACHQCGPGWTSSLVARGRSINSSSVDHVSVSLMVSLQGTSYLSRSDGARISPLTSLPSPTEGPRRVESRIFAPLTRFDKSAPRENSAHLHQIGTCRGS